jgi:uncharacterized protein
MTKDIWLNIPVKDVQKSKAFYKAIRFEFNEQQSRGADSECMLVGHKKVVVMLFQEKLFESFTKHPITDTFKSTELLISIDAESKAEVDTITENAEKAGGFVFGKPSEVQGWMYGSGFCDLDGHRWNVLFMDFSQLPK